MATPSPPDRRGWRGRDEAESLLKRFARARARIEPMLGELRDAYRSAAEAETLRAH